jgi:diguanylate cyclase (GGDEF)-like protein
MPVYLHPAECGNSIRQNAGCLSGSLQTGAQALDFQQPELRVSASFGIATYPLDALDADALIRMADRALYAAKAKGRNRIELIDLASRHDDVPQDA